MRSIHKLQRYSLMAGILILALSVIQPACFPAHAQSDLPVVRAVLFYSPSCGHCHLVITETLPPLIEKYGPQFEIIGVDISQPQGQFFFDAAFKMFNLESAGVPFLVIGDEYLIGSIDIPQRLPGLIEYHLAQGGVDWPDITGLRDAIHASQTAQAPTPTAIPPTSPAASIPTLTPAPVILEPDPPSENTFGLPGDLNLTVSQRIMLDPLGNGIAIMVLLVMIAVLAGALLTNRNNPANRRPLSQKIIIPVLCLIGLGVAGYLAFVETTHTEAVCGPIGDCNTVQQSAYAHLFGILPIGVLGIVGYLVILTMWFVSAASREEIAVIARAATFVLSTFGIIFSIYLTFLEPFVIGATCAWCLASAVIMTALFLATLDDGKQAVAALASIYRT
jgi:uncharacterized membrane protein/thiol-disulfide isomerase/thioredoxin